MRSLAEQKRGRQMRGSALRWGHVRVRRLRMSKWTARRKQRLHADQLLRRPNGRRSVPLQQPEPKSCEDILLQLCLRGVGRCDLSVRLDRDAAGLRVQDRHHGTARQLPATLSGWPDRHRAELPASAEYQACTGTNMSSRPDGHAGPAGYLRPDAAPENAPCQPGAGFYWHHPAPGGRHELTGRSVSLLKKGVSGDARDPF